MPCPQPHCDDLAVLIAFQTTEVSLIATEIADLTTEYNQASSDLELLLMQYWQDCDECASVGASEVTHQKAIRPLTPGEQIRVGRLRAKFAALRKA